MSCRKTIWFAAIGYRQDIRWVIIFNNLCLSIENKNQICSLPIEKKSGKKFANENYLLIEKIKEKKNQVKKENEKIEWCKITNSFYH